MPAPHPLPNYIYKILDSKPPTPLPRALPLSPLDAKDGFIHLSTAAQTPGTANRFYANNRELWLLKIPLKGVEGETRWEEGGSGCFAHVYGRDLGVKEVEGSKMFGRREGQSWGEVLRDGWLE